MDWDLILIGVPLFFVAYSGIGLFLDSKKTVHSAFRKKTDTLMAPGANFSSKMAFNRLFLNRPRLKEKWELMLLRSGHIHGWKVEDFLLYKEITVALAAVVLWRSQITHIGLWIVAVPGSFFLLDFYVKGKIKERKARIQRLLPGLVDLLALALESGLDLMTASERILEKMKPSALRDELATLVQENRLGTPRKEALQHLAFRTDVSDIQSLTSIIIQSEELGTGLASVLRTYSEDMRSRRILRAEEIAGKAPVKILFPMMVFFFPIVFVIIFGPLALNFMANYK